VKLDAPFHLDFVLEGQKAIIEGDDGETYIQGYASDFGLDRQNEAFEPGAFEKGMREFMKNPVVLYHHKHDEPLGMITEFENRADGLWVKGRLDAPEPGTKAADHIRKVRSGTIRGFSVGGKFHRRKNGDGRPLIHTADILEISLTPTPVNPRTLAEVAGKAFPSEDEPEADFQALADRLTAVSELFERAEKAIASKTETPASEEDQP
jgi:HK97 family phage prohead protease